MVKADWVKPGAIVIDVGMNRTEDGLCGDVDFDAVKEVAGGDHAGARRRRPDDDRRSCCATRCRPRGWRAREADAMDLRRLRSGELLAGRVRRRAARGDLFADWFGGGVGVGDDDDRARSRSSRSSCARWRCSSLTVSRDGRDGDVGGDDHDRRRRDRAAARRSIASSSTSRAPNADRLDRRSGPTSAWRSSSASWPARCARWPTSARGRRPRCARPSACSRVRGAPREPRRRDPRPRSPDSGLVSAPRRRR